MSSACFQKCGASETKASPASLMNSQILALKRSTFSDQLYPSSSGVFRTRFRKCTYCTQVLFVYRLCLNYFGYYSSLRLLQVFCDAAAKTARAGDIVAVVEPMVASLVAKLQASGSTESFGLSLLFEVKFVTQIQDANMRTNKDTSDVLLALAVLLDGNVRRRAAFRGNVPARHGIRHARGHVRHHGFLHALELGRGRDPVIGRERGQFLARGEQSVPVEVGVLPAPETPDLESAITGKLTQPFSTKGSKGSKMLVG